MKIFCRKVDGIYVPNKPKKMPTYSYNSNRTIYLSDPYGDKLELGLLKSKIQAKQFIVGLISGAGFPLTNSYYYYDGRDDVYIEDMVQLAKEGAWTWLDDGFDETLYVYADGKFISFDNADYNDAVKAYELRNIESLYYGNGNEVVLFNGYVYYSDDDETWQVDMEAPNNYSDYEWKNIDGTMIALPSWAKSFKDAISKS